MLETHAIVIQVEGEEALVQPLDTGGCGHCASEGGCGGSSLSKLFCSHRPRHFKVSNKVCAKVGDKVQVSIPDGVLLRGAMKLYVMPLILLLLCSAAGIAMAGESAGRDAYAATGAVIGLLLGFVLARLSPGVAQAVASSIITSRSDF